VAVDLHPQHKGPGSLSPGTAARPAALEGLAVAAGLGTGDTFLYPALVFQLSGAPAGQADRGGEQARLAEAGADIAAEAAASDSPDAGALVAMLAEPLFHGSVVDRIDAGMTAADAVVQTTHDLIAIYADLADPVLRQRAEWAEGVGRRLFRRLHGLATPRFGPGARWVLVTDEMSPFEAARLSPAHVAGIVAERGGATSHFAIICKQLGIPVVAGIAGALGVIPPGERCICDGDRGVVHLAPDHDTWVAAAARQAAVERERAALAAAGGQPAVTRDGRRIDLWGNIAGAADVPRVLAAGGTGVGMFRTEFVFAGDEAPSEDRQAALYGDILRSVPGPVVMRTLEAGGDKAIPYLAGEREDNPNLGWQGLRMCLDLEPLFLTQLRAMIRASAAGELWIMFPLVSARWELQRCRELVARAHAEVVRQGGQPGRYRTGIMIEVPAAALLADDYLRDFDFAAIGTNDLTQYTLAADRMNPRVARWYDPYHPGVVRLMAMAARAARRSGKPVGVAGDLASDPAFVPVLVGLGFTFLSATAPRLGAVRRALGATDSRQAQELARTVLGLADADQIRALLHRGGPPD
jgi:phosphotransferase system enzyme I (PtsI)